jgi:hypothetical protein
MTIFQGPTLAQGIQTAINKAILEATTPGAVMHHLLDGSEKVLVIEWNGSLLDPHHAGFDAFRGDGKLTLLRPGHPSYQVPPSVDLDDAEQNIRAGVPLWLLNTSTGWPVVLGIGVLHPVYSSASIAFYDHASRQPLSRVYFADPRVDLRQALPEGHPLVAEQRAAIEEAGGAIEPTPLLAPVFTKAWP